MGEPRSLGPTGGRGIPHRGLLGALLLVACVYGLAERGRFLAEPLRHQDGLYGRIARNYLRYGYPDFGLAQITSPGSPLPRDARVQYQTHPPLAPLLSSLGVAAFGAQAWAIRLPHLLCGLAAVAVLACLSARLGGALAGLYTAAAGALLPIAIRYCGPFADVFGPAFILWGSLAAYSYLRYTEAGRPGWFAALFGASLLALLTDWPAYPLCFALAGHAFWYRSAARRAAMLALPAAALACFAVLWLYARSIPVERNLWGTPLGGAAADWVYGFGAGVSADQHAFVPWAADFVEKFLRHLSPFALLAAAWAGWSAPKALWARANRPGQHVVLLWLWPVPYLVALPWLFLGHEYYHMLFLPAVAVTLGLMAARLHARGPRWAAAGLLACGVFVILWSQYVFGVTKQEWGILRPSQAAWAEDFRSQTAFDEDSAFVLPYTQQMALVADRRVEESVDTAEKVRELRRDTAGAVRVLFAPIGYPFAFAEPAFGRELVSGYEARAGGSTVGFLLDRPQPAGRVAVRAIAPVELQRGIRIEGGFYAPFTAGGGRRFVYLGLRVSGKPRATLPGTGQWRVSFVDKNGRSHGAISVPAHGPASYILECPAGWDLGPGRLELVHLHQEPAGSLGLGQRAARWALRLVSGGWLGWPERVTRESLTRDGLPVTLEANAEGGT